MTDPERILPLWKELESAAADYVLATIVAVEGSSYRRPGACMLLAPDGRRAGTVSGGCLEGEVAKRALWLTENGPVIHRYSTAEEDGERPYGSGCGGVIWLLLERRPTAGPLLHALEQAFHRRIPLAVATILEGEQLGRRAFAGLDHPGSLLSSENPLQELAERTLLNRSPINETVVFARVPARAWTDFRPARPGLWIFGAGDDAQPLVRLAKELGWFVTVADGRSQLVTRQRFPLADGLHVLRVKELPTPADDGSAAAFAHLLPHDAAVAMTHSFEQDSRVLASLLALDQSLAYIGVLGPQRRTRELLTEAAQLLGREATSAADTLAWIDHQLAQLHAPTGLDLGAESPETVALSVIAEILKSFTAATALPLRVVRATAPASVAEPSLKSLG